MTKQKSIDVDDELRNLRAELKRVDAERDLDRQPKPNTPAKKKPPLKAARNTRPIRWDLAKGGTNIVTPPGSVEWPEWLPKNFLNIHVVQEDPLILRDDLFGGGRYPDAVWGLVNNLLYAIEDEAKKVLKEASFFNLENVDSDDWTYLRDIEEETFYALFAEHETLTPKQKNAIAAIRSIEVIRSKTHVVNNHGYMMCDPHHDHTYESLTVAKLLMEMMTLMMAAIRGELWEDLWPHTERGALAEQHCREVSALGVEKRKKKSNKMVELCRTIAKKSTRKTRRGRALFVLETLKKNYPKRRRPSFRSLQDWIK